MPLQILQLARGFRLPLLVQGHHTVIASSAAIALHSALLGLLVSAFTSVRDNFLNSRRRSLSLSADLLILSSQLSLDSLC